MKTFSLSGLAILPLLSASLLCVSAISPGRAGAEPLSGVKNIVLHTRAGKEIVIGKAAFTPEGERSRFKLSFDDKKFSQYFLSMREFKCVEGEEILCHVPYPYPNPQTVSPGDLSWLEHALLFFYKEKSDYGAKMSHGLIYTLKITANSLVGTPQSIDLDEIASPPDDKSRAFFTGDHRYDIGPGARWIESLTIGEP